jgi:hypothetical protein
MQTLVIGKMTKAVSVLASTALTLLCVFTSTIAEEMPKQFDFTVTFTWATSSNETIKLGEKHTGSSWRAIMVATNNAGGVFMNNMVGNCASFTLRSGETLEALGACSYEDKDGDQLYETFKSTIQGKGSIAFIGGTGKFAGIQCEGEYTTVGWARQGAGGVGKKQGRCTFANKS